jgi:dCMP deaminase
MTRLSWDRYFMSIAETVALRSTCQKRHVGCVVVANRIILSTGYNGSMRGAPHCYDAGCVIDGKGDCVRTVHAEANAIAQAAQAGGHIFGAFVYTTCKPCWTCYKLLANAGVMKVGYLEDAGDRYEEEAPHMEMERLEG